MPAKKKTARAAPSPEVFFGTSLPRVLQMLRAACADLGGRYVVDVDGKAWTLDYTSATVVAGAAANVDVTVRLSAAQFASLSTSKVELKKLVADGQAPCEGDRAKLENVSFVLAFLERG
jgi:alkyl sulfatase BDS1-like metallo-beta-lactamase superfamily hydrolase